MKERLQNRFKVSVSETDFQDAWTKAQLTAAIISPDSGQADSFLDKMDRFVDGDGRALIVGVERSFR